MKGHTLGEISRKFFGSWSIEPAFILFYLGYTIKTGAGIVEQLILDKVSGENEAFLQQDCSSCVQCLTLDIALAHISGVPLHPELQRVDMRQPDCRRKCRLRGRGPGGGQSLQLCGHTIAGLWTYWT